MRSYFPVKNLSFRFNFRIKFERSRQSFTFLLVVHFVIPKSFIVINFLLFHNVWLENFRDHLLRISHLWFFNFFKSLGVCFYLHFKIMNKSSKLIDSPVINVNIFALIFNSSHVIHEGLWIDSSFKDFISKKDLFAFFCMRLALHYDSLIFCFVWYKI